MVDRLENISKPQQYFISICSVLMVASLCYSSADFLGYRTVALVLLLTVSLIATLCDIGPVLTAAVLSALTWDFFFIPPKFTLHVDNAEDALMLLMYFIIALLNAALTYKIRQIKKQAGDRERREDVLKLYNTLLNSLSHELRTPLSIIVAATDNLQANKAQLTPANQNELVGEIAKASFRLNKQVDNLLNMSRLESGVIQAKRDWCDVNELVNDVVNRVKEVYPNRIFNISINEYFPLVKLDPGLMDQVLYNLVHNAVQYTPKYCVITIRATCINDKLILVVEDNGPGFAENETGRVFEKFYRSNTHNAGGLGLGLSIVKGFVEAHNGIIILENIEEGGGARFTIEIPTPITYVTQLEQ